MKEPAVKYKLFIMHSTDGKWAEQGCEDFRRMRVIIVIENIESLISVTQDLLHMNRECE